MTPNLSFGMSLLSNHIVSSQKNFPPSEGGQGGKLVVVVATKELLTSPRLQTA